jgi:hypothetical protein
MRYVRGVALFALCTVLWWAVSAVHAGLAVHFDSLRHDVITFATRPQVFDSDEVIPSQLFCLHCYASFPPHSWRLIQVLVGKGRGISLHPGAPIGVTFFVTVSRLVGSNAQGGAGAFVLTSVNISLILLVTVTALLKCTGLYVLRGVANPAVISR